MGLVGMTKNIAFGGGKFGLNQYTTNMARKAMGLALSTNKDGEVQHFSRSRDFIKRAAIQSVSQMAYGTLRSYPRYIKYFEKKSRERQLKTNNTSLVNTDGEYYKLRQEQLGFELKGDGGASTGQKTISLIAEKEIVINDKVQVDAIVGNPVVDFLMLTVTKEEYEKTFESKEKKFSDVFNTSSQYVGSIDKVEFVDPHAVVTVSSKKNIVQTVVQGRDYTRKELISGGDLSITVSGKITSKYPDIYPEADVSKFIKLMQYHGIIKCHHTLLKQFNVEQLIVTSFNVPQSDMHRNVQPYSFTCVAVEPSMPVELKIADQEKAEVAIKQENATDKWIKLARYGAELIEPTILLNITKTWL